MLLLWGLPRSPSVLTPDFDLDSYLSKLTSVPASDSDGFEEAGAENLLVTWGRPGGWPRSPGWSEPPRLPLSSAAAPPSPAGPSSPYGAGGGLGVVAGGLGGRVLPLACRHVVLIHAVPGRGGLDLCALDRAGHLGFEVLVVETLFGWQSFLPGLETPDRLGQLSPAGPKMASAACRSSPWRHSCRSS